MPKRLIVPIAIFAGCLANAAEAPDLFNAARGGDIKTLEQLIVDRATAFDRLEAVRTLVQHGADTKSLPGF